VVRRLRLALILGGLAGALVVVSCAIDESGTQPTDSGGVPDVNNGKDAALPDVVIPDVTFDVPDLGAGETESGLPCTCVDILPTGYVAVEYVSNMQPPCTVGYDASVDYIENPSAGATTCGCSCGASPSTAPSCACGTDPATFPISSGNNDCTDVTTGQSLKASVGSCYNSGGTQTLNPGNHDLNEMLVSPPGSPCAATGGTCGPAVQTQNIPPANAEQGVGCTLSGVASQGSCADTEVCVPNATGPFQICITNYSLATCMDPDFPYAHLVGSMPILDTRSCGPSSCGCTLVDAGSCGTPQLELWNSSNNCMGSPDETLPADNTTCTHVGFDNMQTFHSTRYTVAQDGGACAFTGTYTAQGGLGVTNPFIVCCHTN
jgi:hypothetical protein